MRRLRAGEWIAGAGGVALLAAMFLRWYGPSDAIGPDEGWVAYAPAGGGATAWQAFGALDVVLALLALLPLALVVAQATRPSPSVPVMLSVLTTLGGALATLLILYRIADQPAADEVVDVRLGAWLGLAAALVVAVGGWRSMRAEAVPGAAMPPIQDLPAPAP